MITKEQFKKTYFDFNTKKLSLNIVESIISIAYSNFRLGYITGRMDEVNTYVDFYKQNSKKGHKNKDIVEKATGKIG